MSKSIMKAATLLMCVGAFGSNPNWPRSNRVGSAIDAYDHDFASLTHSGSITGGPDDYRKAELGNIPTELISGDRYFTVSIKEPDPNATDGFKIKQYKFKVAGVVPETGRNNYFLICTYRQSLLSNTRTWIIYFEGAGGKLKPVKAKKLSSNGGADEVFDVA